jgi:hypothetical protein
MTDPSAPATATHYEKLVVFHPSPNLVGVVDDLLKQEAPSLDYENIIKPDLLNEAIRTGITDKVRKQVTDVIEGVPLEPRTLIFCTCSTLGETAEEIGRSTNRDVIRIDRPMAEEAVAIGGRVGVAAALESTFGPTTDLLKGVARDQNKAVDFKIIHCKEAWAHKQQGDDDGYIAEAAKCLDANADDVDVIVLAQGSMAPAKDLTSVDVPILSSPETGVNRVIKLMSD